MEKDEILEKLQKENPQLENLLRDFPDFGSNEIDDLIHSLEENGYVDLNIEVNDEEDK